MANLRNRALLIGNWQYNDPDNQLHVLRGPKNDLELLQKALVHPQFGLFTQDDVRVLDNRTGTELAGDFLDFVKDSPSDCGLLIYYTGHAGKLADGKLGFFGVDIKYERRDAYAFDTSRPKTWITQFRPGARTVLILDCCYAGAFKGVTLSDDLLVESFGTGVAVLASAGNQETPDAENDDDPSPFTDLLAKLLVEPELQPTAGQFLHADELYTALVNHRPPLQPRPKQSMQAVGLIPIARRAMVLEQDADSAGMRGYHDQTFDTINLVFDQKGCTADIDGVPFDLARLDVNRQAAIRRLSTLADALMRAEGYTSEAWRQRAVSKAWHTVGANLFESAIPHAVQERMLNRIAAGRGNVLKIRLRFEDGVGQALEPYPWEYLQVVPPDTSDRQAERDTQLVDLPAPLALRPGILIERVAKHPHGVGTPLPASSTTNQRKPTIGVVNALPSLLSGIGERTAEELDALKGVELLFQLHGQRATWGKVTDALDQLPRHLVLYVPVNREGGSSGLGFNTSGTGAADWRSATQLADELAEREIQLESLTIVTFAASPGNDTVRGLFDLAKTLSGLEIGPVIFVCHWPGFESSVTEFESLEPGTFPGLFLQALAAGKSLDNSLYYARNRMLKRYTAQNARLIGVPGYYAGTDTADVASSKAATGLSPTVVSSKERRP